MKHSVFVKFIAIFLCTAALLGAVGSGFGIWALTATELYEKSFDEVYQERLESKAINLAYEKMQRYASGELGGCNIQLLDGYYAGWGDYDSFDWDVAYVIRDAEGNAVLEQEMEDAIYSLEFPVTVSYVKLLAEETMVDYEDRMNQQTVTAPVVEDYDTIPAKGAMVSSIFVAYADGHTETVGSDSPFGYLFRDGYGRVYFEMTDGGVLDYRDVSVTEITFYWSDGEVLYQASDPDGVGCFYQAGESLIFVGGDGSGETAQTELFDVYDDVPPQGTYVYAVQLQLAKTGEVIWGEPDGLSLGTASRENGTVVLRCDNWADFEFSKPADITYIQMTGEEGRLLYEAGTIGDESIVGTFAYGVGGHLEFTAADPYGIALAMEPPEVLEPAVTDGEEPTAEVPETIEETATLETAEETAVAETTAQATEAVDETVEPETTATTEFVEETGVPETTVGATEVVEETTVPENMEPTLAPEDVTVDTGVLDGATAEYPDVEYFRYYNYEEEQWMRAALTTEILEGYTVEVQLGTGAMEREYEWQLLELAYGLKDSLPMVLGFSLLILAIMAVYLCCAAGRKPGTETVHAGGLNCIPLDLYLGLVTGGVVLLAFLCMAVAEYLLPSDARTGLAALAALAFGASLLVVGFCFACAAQFKTPGGYWWRSSLCGWGFRLLVRGLSWCVRICKWIWDKVPRIFHEVWAIVVWAWGLVWKIWLAVWNQVKKVWHWCDSKIVRFYGMLPLTWQWLLGGAVLLVLCVLAWANRNDGWGFVWLLLGFGLILFVSHCFGILHEATKRMSKGDLDEKVDDKFMVGCFQEFAQDLNSLAGVAVIAAQKQLKSERMKTELITNVSHDIKTPLTSIINYVDLLQKPHTEAEQAQYLEVLDRQSQRLKKLIEDLMEMSKASTGNLAVDITKVDAAEAINQALGEFADKLDKAQLTPVFRQPDDPITMMADGRLVWRVMSNLLGNAVKYALPGTRLYLDLMEMEGKVIISLKNISREELNVNADELLERFVRGDTSRNTEGSGLGLNIARSLMELQKGQLQLLVDGDLFKVTLIFPGA